MCVPSKKTHIEMCENSLKLLLCALKKEAFVFVVGEQKHLNYIIKRWRLLGFNVSRCTHKKTRETG